MGERVEGDQRTENLSKGIVKMVNKRIQLHHDQYLFLPAPSSHTIPEFPVGRLQLWSGLPFPSPGDLPDINNNNNNNNNIIITTTIH